MTVADFDGVTYHLSTPESKTTILISLGWACAKELFDYGAKDILKREYGSLLLDTAEQGYDVSLSIDLEKVSNEPGISSFSFFSNNIDTKLIILDERDELIKKISLLKRNLLAAPFEIAFKEQEECEKEQKTELNSQLMAVHYREEEAIYIKSNFDRVTVIFSTTFKDETDKVFGKVFLQVRELVRLEDEDC